MDGKGQARCRRETEMKINKPRKSWGSGVVRTRTKDLLS